MSKFKLLAYAVAAASVSAAVPASALVTFASFTPADSSPNARFEGNNWFTAPNGIGGPAPVDVLFNFLVDGAPAGLSASYTLNASVPSAPLPDSGAFNLGDASGSFSFIANEAFSAAGQDYAAGTNLLSGSFSNAFFDGTVGGSTGALRGSTGGGTAISYTSELLDFTGSAPFDFSLVLTSIQPPLGGDGNLADFTGSMGGQFSSSTSPAPGVPEPESWAMLVLGFGLVGVSVRRRQRQVAVAA